MSGAPSARAPRKRRLEIFPYGFTIANGPARPVLIFKDKTGEHVLPVWAHPLDATMALHEQSGGAAMEAHAVARALMSRLGLRAERCDIDELVGNRQYARIRFAGDRGEETEAPRLFGRAGRESVRVRADHAMSFCLASRTRFFSTPEFMAKCRTLNGSEDPALERLEAALSPTVSIAFSAAAGEGLEADPEIDGSGENGTKNSPYMM